MVKKTKGRQKIEMVKMKNESNLQVTFSKRRSGLFKKASELCTLCGAEVAIIVFSPGRKVFSFGHPNVETVLDRFLNNNVPPPYQHNIQPHEASRNSVVQELNNHLTEVVNQLELEKKKNEELREIREKTKMLGNWMEDAIEGLSLPQVIEFKGRLEILKKEVALEASKIFQAHAPQQNFYVGSSSNAAFRTDGSNINPDMDMFGQSSMVNMNAVNYNQNPNLSYQQIPFGNNDYGNIPEGFVPGYGPEYQNQNLNFKRENNSDGYPFQSRHGPSG